MAKPSRISTVNGLACLVLLVASGCAVCAGCRVDYVSVHAWFSASPIPNARLFDDAGALTSLGRVYVGLPHDAACAP